MAKSFQTASSTGETSTSSLMYTPRPSDSGRVMRCRATNPQMNVGVLEDSWTLDVQCKSVDLNAEIYVRTCAH